MYRITNVSDSEVVAELLDHSRMWNDRLRVILLPGSFIEIEDTQLSKEIQYQETRHNLAVEYLIDDAPVSLPEPLGEAGSAEGPPSASRGRKLATARLRKPSGGSGDGDDGSDGSSTTDTDNS